MRKPPTRLKKTIGWLLSAFLLVVYFSPQAQLLRTLPARLSVAVGQQAVLDAPFPLTVEAGEDVSAGASLDETLEEGAGTSTATISFLGLLPLREVEIDISDDLRLYPGGQAVGVALHTQGVLVVGTSDLSGAYSPARLAGVKAGDLITRAGGKPLESAAQLTEMVAAMGDTPLPLTIRRGEVFALVGENGAGKSTLMNLLYGLQVPTLGEIYIKGKPTGPQHGPENAMRMGVSMVHQHFKLVPSFTVAHNVMLGHEPRRGLFYDGHEAEETVRRLSAEYGLKVEPGDVVRDLSVGIQQRVEILKALRTGADVLILDDIQELIGKDKTQNTFFHIFNHLHLLGKQLILTSDKAPVDLQGMEERLITRLKWGLTAELDRPDLDLRKKILKNKISHDGVVIPDDVFNFIASNVTENVRDVEGIVASLLAYSTAFNRMIDLPLTKQVVSRVVKLEKKQVSVESIQDVVCKYYNLELAAIQTNSRKREIVQARQVTMYLAKKYTDSSFSHIGKIVGKRDHATVLHACKTVRDQIETNKSFRSSVEEIEALLKA